MTEKQSKELLLFDTNTDIENTPNMNIEKLNKYFLKHKFIEKICKIVENKLFVSFYIDFFDNYKTKSPQVILFINDFKKFLEKNNQKSGSNISMINITSIYNGNFLNNISSTNLYNTSNINSITIGNIISLLSLSNITNCSTVLLNKSIDYVKSFVSSSYNIFIYIFDYYREYYMFGNKELVDLCMRLDFSNNVVYHFGQDVINL